MEEAEALEDSAEEEMAEDHSAEEIEIREDLEEVKEDPLKCMKLYALNVEKKQKFHSSQQETNQYIAEIVLINKAEIEVQIEVSVQAEQQGQECHKNSLIKLIQNLTRL